MGTYAALAMLLFIVSAVLFGKRITTFILSSDTLTQQAHSIIRRCHGEPFPESCYNEAIPNLMHNPTNLSMEEAFDVTKKVMKEDTRFVYCHILGHNVGEQEVSKNPGLWKATLARCPSDLCNYGCQHGVLTHQYKSEILTDAQITAIIPEMVDTCEKLNDATQKVLCFHGMGHIAMFITNGELQKSIHFCNRLDPFVLSNHPQLCMEGVFMSLFAPMGPDEIALVKDKTPKKDAVDTFCGTFTGEAYHACHRGSWSLFTDAIMTPEGVGAFCSYTNDTGQQEKCLMTALTAISHMIGEKRQDAVLGIIEFCNRLGDTLQSTCFSSSARRLVQSDPAWIPAAVNVCQAAKSGDREQACFTELDQYGSARYLTGSDKRNGYCNAFPKDQQARCKAN